MNPAFRAISGANLFWLEPVPYLPEDVCQIWLWSEGRVKKGGTDIQTYTVTQTHTHKVTLQLYIVDDVFNIGLSGRTYKLKTTHTNSANMQIYTLSRHIQIKSITIQLVRSRKVDDVCMFKYVSKFILSNMYKSILKNNTIQTF